MMISIRIVGSICTFCNSRSTIFNKRRQISFVVIIYSLVWHLFFTNRNQLTSFSKISKIRWDVLLSTVFFTRLKTKSYPTLKKLRISRNESIFNKVIQSQKLLIMQSNGLSTQTFTSSGSEIKKTHFFLFYGSLSWSCILILVLMTFMTLWAIKRFTIWVISKNLVEPFLFNFNNWKPTEIHWHL